MNNFGVYISPNLDRIMYAAWKFQEGSYIVNLFS